MAKTSAVFIGFLLSLVIESIQGATGIGYFDIDDLILNTIGTMIGWAIWRVAVNHLGRHS